MKKVGKWESKELAESHRNYGRIRFGDTQSSKTTTSTTMLSSLCVNNPVDIQAQSGSNWNAQQEPLKVIAWEESSRKRFQVCLKGFHFILLDPNETNSDMSSLFPNLFSF